MSNKDRWRARVQIKKSFQQMTSKRDIASKFCMVAVLGFVQAAQAQDPDSEIAPKAVHRTIQNSAHTGAGRPKSGGGTGITYHGGPLLGTVSSKPVNVYVIWYGNWSGNSATTLIPNFLNAIGGSPYFNINTSYYNGSGAHVQNAVAFSGTATDNYSQGAALSDAQIQAIVSSAITSGKLPSDSGAV